MRTKEQRAENYCTALHELAHSAICSFYGIHSIPKILKPEEQYAETSKNNSVARRIAQDGFGWSLPPDVRANVYKKLEASNEPDFKNPKYFCSNCKTDFQLAPEENKIIGGMIDCPNCGERLEKAVAEIENPETAKQVKGERAIMLDCARSASSILPKDSIPNYLLYMPQS